MKVNEGGKSYNAVIVGGPFLNPGYKLVGNSAYPRIAEDYAHEFEVLKSLPVDFFLGAHGSYFNLEAKYPRLKEGAPSPFLDPDGYKTFVANAEKSFQAELAKQKAAVKK
jgi:metallo-beta-lactamase class B